MFPDMQVKQLALIHKYVCVYLPAVRTAEGFRVTAALITFPMA